jgi:biotin operon repressor
MTARNHAPCSQDDWRNYNDLGAGDLVLVDVADYSPAWGSGLRSRSWIVDIDGRSFNDFERLGAPVGAAVVAKGFHPARGHFLATFTLVERPKVKRAPRAASRARVPHAKCGRIITRDDRPKWLTSLAMARYLSMAARLAGGFLCNRAINDHGFTDRWTYRTIARDIGVSRATVQRAIAELRQAGFIEVQSGRRARRVNGYTLTWPAAVPGEVVIPFPNRSSPQSPELVPSNSPLAGETA